MILLLAMAYFWLWNDRLYETVLKPSGDRF